MIYFLLLDSTFVPVSKSVFHSVVNHISCSYKIYKTDVGSVVTYLFDTEYGSTVIIGGTMKGGSNE